MSLQDAVAYMWGVVDQGNRVDWGEGGFTLDLQQKGRYNQDRCGDPLFSSVNPEHPFWTSPVTKAFVALLDNYEREVGVEERDSSQEKAERGQFLDALAASPVVRFAFEYLKQHGRDRRCAKLGRMADFEHLLFDLWLAPYRRLERNDSSGFEHVFVGEEKDGKVTGVHNWVQYYLEEKKGNINYMGWVGKQDSDYDDDVNLATIKFGWADSDDDVSVKPCSTILCGSTVEFEIALLTLVFLAGEQNGDNPLVLGNEPINVKCFEKRVRHGGPKIGTAYIEIR